MGWGFGWLFVGYGTIRLLTILAIACQADAPPFDWFRFTVNIMLVACGINMIILARPITGRRQP